MLRYYLRLAVSDLQRTPIISSLMVLAMALGVGASMTMITVLHVITGDPLPDRSPRLFRPYLDPLPLNYPRGGAGPDPSLDLTWPDAMALVRQAPVGRSAAMAGGEVLLRPAGSGASPSYIRGRYTTPEFFRIFAVPLAAGNTWSRADEDAHARVVVLNESLARRLFGEQPAVGKSVNLDNHGFRVIGVVSHWRPHPAFYEDDVSDMFGDADQFYLPLTTAMDLNLTIDGDISAWGAGDDGPAPLTSATTSWLQLWVELDTAREVSAYQNFLSTYADEQKNLGRFQRPASTAHLYSLMQWLSLKNIVPKDVRLQLWLALAFLFVCMFNIISLLLTKFLRRSREISIRRALGATRADIFFQLSTEAGLIGLTGGVLGICLAEFGLWSVRQRADSYAHLAHMDSPLLAVALALSIATGVLAGVLPAWRASRVQPAMLLNAE